jgi:hypothetical protein
MTVNEKGQIVLTAYPTPNTTTRPASDRPYCNNSTSNQVDSLSETLRDRNSYSSSTNYLVSTKNSSKK